MLIFRRMQVVDSSAAVGAPVAVLFGQAPGWNPETLDGIRPFV